MAQISDLSAINQRTVRRLSKDKKVRADRITGLLDTIESEFYKEHPDATGIEWSYGTTAINGSAPRGRPLPYHDAEEVVDEIKGDQHITVIIGLRRADTRAGIHVHESGGATFVIGGKGRVTDFVEGFQGMRYPVGSYYYMPSNIPMSASNLAKRDVRLMDIFVTPFCDPYVTIIEPGYPGYNQPI